ncbi:DUF6894 family protein [Methylobacterium oxalidis]|uniref:DUF6894 domain-containing protein n=1 Tax=Methylobacterium oxalidis TaxID=944322 RepID=A0A512JCJ1_9HYPH|nr:hypothetical protein [Methylobacterium oxalidis]GEP07668.1 hypothetical protein MOX02_57060 [Methylobacterium oxalidis]GJE34010.1 hypothetical protein LDDCCGHA_4214 [Methylobacterium oxalidis]GLS65996.1 hypothetical protein GCM10007888_43780 [Methylobacterium oxalidis]
MARYFFDITDDLLSVTDGEGEECASHQHAATRVAQILTEIAADTGSGDGQSNLTARVRDQAGQVVYEAALRVTGMWIDPSEHPDQRKAAPRERSAPAALAA